MARIKGLKKTNRYPDEFKIKAVQLADHPDILAKDVADDLGVHPTLLYRWRKEYKEGKFHKDGRKKGYQDRGQKGLRDAAHSAINGNLGSDQANYLI